MDATDFSNSTILYTSSNVIPIVYREQHYNDSSNFQCERNEHFNVINVTELLLAELDRVCKCTLFNFFM